MAVQAIRGGPSLAIDGVLIEDILRLASASSDLVCNHVATSGNSVAHVLVPYALHYVLDVATTKAIPRFVSPFF